jgi:hypothetical protein
VVDVWISEVYATLGTAGGKDQPRCPAELARGQPSEPQRHPAELHPGGQAAQRRRQHHTEMGEYGI